ncbi:MAG TPA: GH32 C-terminal domain-containing protein, partial [Candidatus Acidoferrum sp.]|nr:GH32 C-terminal domain-containing protein [Candidatus Acidoferrum sp.]
NFYATETWANTDTGDGRRIQAAWMRGSSFPNMPFNQQISFPCELTLHGTPNGLRIFREPISQIALLHRGQDAWRDRVLKDGELLPLEPSGQLFQIKAEVDIPSGAHLIFKLRGVAVDLTSKTVASGSGPASVADRIKALEILVDRASIETFVNEGEISSTRFVLPDEEGLSVKAQGGEVAIRSLVVYPLNSAWAPGAKN